MILKHKIISKRLKTLKYFLIVLLAFCVVSCNAQSRQTSPTDGVFCGYLDKDGVLWFGTKGEGVFSFDGTSFTNYSEKNGLSNNHVSSILEDSEGNLWFGTADGLCHFNRKTFTHVPIPWSDTSSVWLDKVYPIVNPNEVQSMIQDKNGIFWLGTNGAGAYRYDGLTFTNYLSEVGDKMPDSLYHNIIQSITEDNKGYIWFTSMSHGGVSRYDGETFTQFMPEDGLSDDMLRTSFMDSEGNIWFGFNGNRNSGLTYYDGKSFINYSKEDGLCNTNTRGIYEDKNGLLWLGSGRGNLCVFDGKSFTEFTTKEGQRFEWILFIMEDDKDNIWFGGKNGLWRFDGDLVTDMTQNNKQ